MTSSSNEPVSDALGSSRRAASSSSATSGRPPDRSATRRSRLADARSPSMPSIRAASSSRSSGGSVRRSGGRGPATIDPRSAVHGSSRPTTSGWCVPMIASRCSRAIRGQERHQRPGGGIGEVQVLDDEHDRMLFAHPSEQPEDTFEGPCLATFRGGRPAAVDRDADRRQARREIGQQPDDLGRRRTEQAGEVIRRDVAQGRSDRPDDGAVRLVGAGRPGASRAGRSSARAARASARWPRRGNG